MRITPLILFIFAISCAYGGQKPLSLTMDEAVSRAMETHPTVVAVQREIEAARHAVRAAGALTNPEIVLTPELTNSGSDEALLVRQPLEINGARSARVAAARARLRSAEAHARVELAKLIAEVRLAYLDLVRAQERRSLARDAAASAEEIDRITQRQVQLGSRAGVEQIQTSVEAARARRHLVVAEGAAAGAAAALSEWVGADVGTLPPLSSPGEAPTETAAIEAALARRAEISAELSDADAYRQEARMVRAEGLPDIAPQFRIERFGSAADTSGFGIAISVPLIDYGSRANRVKQIEAEAASREARAEATRVSVRRQVREALATLSATAEALKQFESGALDQARRLMEASRVGYQEGKTAIIALLEAQRTFRAVQSDHANAVVDYAAAHVILQRAMGALPETLPPSWAHVQRISHRTPTRPDSIRAFNQ